MITTLRQRERRDGIVLKQVKYPVPPKRLEDITDAFEAGITSRTKVILVSHVVFLTGQILPVRDICDLGRAKGIEVIVDGAHSVAHIPFTQKDLGCDYFGASLHKWLYAPKGTGLLYVKKEKIEKIWSLMASDQKQSADIRKFEEIGTHSAAMRLAIGEALLFHQGLGPQRKAARLRYLRNYWANKLSGFPNVRFHTSLEDSHSCGITTVEIVGVDPNSITSLLMGKHKIFTVGITTDEFRGNRITPNVYTTLTELDRFCEVMTNIARNGLPK
jgi:isopenicillin-N epimerase